MVVPICLSEVAAEAGRLSIEHAGAASLRRHNHQRFSRLEVPGDRSERRLLEDEDSESNEVFHPDSREF
jgi:hypothetical protein